MFLRQLPESLFTQDCVDLFAQVGGNASKHHSIKYIGNQHNTFLLDRYSKFRGPAQSSEFADCPVAGSQPPNAAQLAPFSYKCDRPIGW